VLAQVAIQAVGLEVAVGIDALGAQRVHRQDVRLGRVGVAEADRPADQIAQLAHVAVGAGDEM
jgi:hypothetical protein